MEENVKKPKRASKKGDPTSNQVDLESEFMSSDVMMITAKTLAGIGGGIVLVAFGVPGIAAAMDVAAVPAVLTKVAGAVFGGGVGLATGVAGHRKYRAKKKLAENSKEFDCI